MFSAIRSRVRVTPAGVIAVFALVLAMSGGAYAAGRYAITSTKQISPKVLKALGGKTGLAGAAGAQGSGGAQGPAGAQGAAGAAGVKGETGPAGEKGAPGEKGPKGTTGSPWSAGGTLPAGATETGGWTMGDGSSVATGAGVPIEEFNHAAISFTIPLAQALQNNQVQSNPVGFPTGASEEEMKHCPGSVSEPKAMSDFLCVYTGESSKVIPLAPEILELSGGDVQGASTAGAMLALDNVGEHSYAVGSWAVTGGE